MRTYFGPDETTDFEQAKDLLARRFQQWTSEPVDLLAVSAALDFRNQSSDGRLGYWTGELVEEFLLSYCPRVVMVDPVEAEFFPDTVRLFLQYLHEVDLADPAGDSPDELAVSVARSVLKFDEALDDESNFSIGKYWIAMAREHGVEPDDGEGMDRFIKDLNAGKIDYDEDLVAGLVSDIEARHQLPGEHHRTELPVVLHSDDELREAAEQSRVLGQLRKFVEWVGEGRALTTKNNLKVADARELVVLLDTGDIVDPEIGGRVSTTKSSTSLRNLTRLVGLAKKSRLVRVVKNKLVPVAKSKSLLRDSLQLWNAVFDAVPELPVFGAADRGVRPMVMFDFFAEELTMGMLKNLYGLDDPFPVCRIVEVAVQACAGPSWIDSEDDELWDELGDDDFLRELQAKAPFAELTRDVAEQGTNLVIDLLAELGAVKRSVATPAAVYQVGADDGHGDNQLLPPASVERLRKALAPGAGPVDLVALTPLATQAMHDLSRREGRYAPVIGELVDASPAQLLGMVSEYYTRESTKIEIAGWLAAHGGGELAFARLVEAIRRSAFRARAAAMLTVLADNVPDRSAFLHKLRTDEKLGPIATNFLVENGEIDRDDLSFDEGNRAMAESFITMLELGGPAAVLRTIADAPTPVAEEILASVVDSGHPDQTALAEIREAFGVFKAHSNLHPLAGLTRTKPRKNKPKNKKRRR